MGKNRQPGNVKTLPLEDSTSIETYSQRRIEVEKTEFRKIEKRKHKEEAQAACHLGTT